MTIRAATMDDIGRMVELGRGMHAESPSFRGLGFDEGKVRAHLAHAIGQGCALLHVTDAGLIDGGFAGVVVERWFSRDPMLVDLALFVEETQRGGIVAARLLRSVKAWCERRGLAPEAVQLGISTGVHADKTGALYERMGFERFGGLYRLRGY